MNKKILLFSRDPGGANAVAPLFLPLTKKGYEVTLFGKDFALSQYERFNLSGLNLFNFTHGFSKEKLSSFIKNEKCDLLVTGTSGDDTTEKYFWEIASSFGVKTIAILDSWLNYGLRFSRYSISEIENYLKKPTIDYLPDKICVMDNIAKEGLLGDGIESSRIVVTGSPYFEYVESQKYKLLKDNSGEKYIITYMSEPLTETYVDCNKLLGFTETSIFRDLLDSLSVISDHSQKEIILRIRLHPKEKKEKFLEIIATNNQKINIEFDVYKTSMESIINSNLVCGVSSMVLIESVILAVPSISVQIDLKGKNRSILDSFGILKSVFNRKMLTNELKSIILQGKFRRRNFSFIKNPIKNIISLINQYETCD